MVDRRAHGFHRLRVKQVVAETTDTISVVLEVPDDLRDLFRYQAGQFCTLRVQVDGDELLRSYSMSSAPETDPDLTVTVKRVPGGRVSNWLHDHLAVGDTVETTKPAGVFCAREGERPIVAFCAGSGVTPVMSIAKSVLDRTHRHVRLLYANRDIDAVIFRRRWQELETSHPGRVEVRHHLDDEAGFVDADTVERFVSGDLEADFYICGPTPFMDLVESTLDALGVDPGRIAIERFVNAGQTVPPPSGAPASAATVSTGDEVPETIVLILKGKRHEITYQPGDSVLETARRGGLAAPFSCEAGNCATCMALVHEGSVRMRANNALTAEEVDEGWVLTCQSLPEGRSLTVEYESF
jgi:ferredoxin-NADP reductase